MGAGADHLGRAGRRGDRRQDRDRHRHGEEPRRRLPLARARRDRRDAARVAPGARAPERRGGALEDRAARRRSARHPRRRRVQGGALRTRPARPRPAPLAEPRHTFAHALEAGADYELPHGEAVALGLVAALRLSGRDTAPVEHALQPRPVRVDRDRAWDALLRDKKRSAGAINLVLLGATGPVVESRPADEVRAALYSLTLD